MKKVNIFFDVDGTLRDNSKGDLVLDNVAGSGTTGIAAQNLNRNFILMEKEPEYVEVMKKRLESNKEQCNDKSN